jgi:hypothetical protein
MKNCKYCGNEIKNNAIRCIHCGKYIEGKRPPNIENIDNRHILAASGENISSPGSYIKYFFTNLPQKQTVARTYSGISIDDFKKGYPIAEYICSQENILGKIGGIFLTDFALYIGEKKFGKKEEIIRIEYDDIVIVEKTQNKIRVGGLSPKYDMSYTIKVNSQYQFGSTWPINDGLFNNDDIWKINLQTMDSFWELLQNIVKENSSEKHIKMAENIKKTVKRTDEKLNTNYLIYSFIIGILVSVPIEYYYLNSDLPNTIGTTIAIILILIGIIALWIWRLWYFILLLIAAFVVGFLGPAILIIAILTLFTVGIVIPYINNKKDKEKLIQNPNDADALNNQGYEAFKKKDYEKAINYFNQSIKANPDLQLAIDNLEIVLTKQKIDGCRIK